MSRWPLLMAAVVVADAVAAEPVALPAGTQLQRPIAIVVWPERETAIVALERAGTLVEVDYERGAVNRTFGPFGVVADMDRLSPQQAIVAVSDPPSLVVVDVQANASGAHSTLRWPTRPTGLRVSGDGQRVAVVSRGARLVRCLQAADLKLPDAGSSIALPFQPGRCLWLPDHRHLLVADAYGGRLAIIDAAAGELASVRSIPAHNIAGLALGRNGERVYLTHQAIHGGAQTSREDVHWGGILTNVLRSVAVRDLLDPLADVLAHNVTVHLGDIGRAAGDPAGVTIRSDGVAVATFAGVNELAFDRGLGFEWKRVTVGARPTAVALTPDGQQALVVNTLDDSLSVVRLAGEGTVQQTIPLGVPRELSAGERGERFFFDARLSHDGWMSCHSCHTDGHTNGQLVDNFTDGTEYTPKRVLSLRGVRDTAPYAWDGHLATLSDQVRHSVTSTMQGEPLADSQVSDLVAYLSTLAVETEDRPNTDQTLIARGRRIFDRLECGRCHTSPSYTSAETYDVGLKDERGLDRFNPPSLRGLRAGDAFLHDGRAQRLEEVFQDQRHRLSAPLDEDELPALTAFLKSL